MENLGWIVWVIDTINRSNLTNAVVTLLIFLFGIIGSLLLGVGITYFVQRQTQKREWEREHSVKINKLSQKSRTVRGFIVRMFFFTALVAWLIYKATLQNFQ